MTWLYALECRGGRIYIGIASDARARIAQHCAGKGAKFTQAFPPVSFIVAVGLESHNTAARLEYRLKQLSRAAKIAFFSDLLAEASRCPTERLTQLPGVAITDASGQAGPLYGFVVANLNDVCSDASSDLR